MKSHTSIVFPATHTAAHLYCLILGDALMYHMHAQLPPTPTPSPLISPSEMLKALQKELNVSTHMYDIHRYAHVHLYIYIYI